MFNMYLQIATLKEFWDDDLLNNSLVCCHNSLFHAHTTFIYMCLLWEKDPFEMKGKRGFFHLMHFSVGRPFFITAGVEILQLCFLVLDLLCFDSFPFLDQHISAAVNVHSVLSLFLTGSDFSIRGIKICLDSQFCLYKSFSSESLQGFFWCSDFCFISKLLLISYLLSVWTFCVFLNFLLFCILELSSKLNFLYGWTFCLVQLSIWFNFLIGSTFCIIYKLHKNVSYKISLLPLEFLLSSKLFWGLIVFSLTFGF